MKNDPCFTCTLPECDEKSAKCALRIARAAAAGVALDEPKPTIRRRGSNRHIVITAAIVNTIRQLRREGKSQREVAELLGVSRHTVSKYQTARDTERYRRMDSVRNRERYLERRDEILAQKRLAYRAAKGLEAAE